MNIPTRIAASILAAQLALLLPGLSQTPQLSVDALVRTGTVLHGATGSLYGVSQPNIPNVNLIASINPQITAQKAPNGLQHPMRTHLILTRSK
jgi:hypothetical protein